MSRVERGFGNFFLKTRERGFVQHFTSDRPPTGIAQLAAHFALCGHFTANGRSATFTAGFTGIGLNTSTSNGSPTRLPHTSSRRASIISL